jgi:OOP family OmpA-OmpF porin
LTLTGIAANPPVKAAAEAAVGDLPEGYSAVVAITSMLETVAPFRVDSVKSDGAQRVSGVVPDVEARARIADVVGEDAAAGLKTAWGVPDGNWGAVAGRGFAVLDALESGEMRLVDRVLTLTGRAATAAEKARAEDLLAELPAGYSARVDIGVMLQIASPFVFDAVKTADGYGYGGNITEEADREWIAGHMTGHADWQEMTEDLVIAAGVPDDAWMGVAARGLDALTGLESGEMHLADRVLTLTGTAQTPVEKQAVEQALAGLPAGYTAHTGIAMLDDGSPAAYRITYNPVTGATVEGKLPKGMSPEALASALGLRSVSGTPAIGRTGNTGQAVALSKRLNALSGWLPELEAFTLSSDGAQTVLEAEVAAGVDRAQVGDAFVGGFWETATVRVAASGATPGAGAVRESIIEGKQVFSGGFWLPVRPGFVAGAQNCARASDAVLTGSRINFLSGSADLDARSVRVINNIAAIMLNCLAGTDLKVEVGGHTDASGGLALNMKLSQSRAQAVVDALVARGVPGDPVTAKGYGPTLPVADNDTDAGKAANRRTTIRWSGPGAATQTTTGPDDGPATQVSE